MAGPADGVVAVGRETEMWPGRKEVGEPLLPLTAIFLAEIHRLYSNGSQWPESQEGGLQAQRRVIMTLSANAG
jgi:hypothetical protein